LEPQTAVIPLQNAIIWFHRYLVAPSGIATPGNEDGRLTNYNVVTSENMASLVGRLKHPGVFGAVRVEVIALKYCLV
jgi:hypothetical protein